MGREPGAPLLHLWNAAGERVVRSFFVPPSRRGLESEEMLTGFVDAAVSHNQVAVLYTRSDTIYLFDTRGEPRGKLPLRSPFLRPMLAKLEGRATREAITAWAAGFSTPSNVFWAGRRLLVQYYDMEDGEQRWSLVALDRRGRRAWEARDTPRLLAAAPDGGRLFFVAPGAEAPNTWAVAALRSPD